MKQVLSYINMALCEIGAITLVFVTLALITELDYLEAGGIALTAGSILSLFMNLEVQQW